MKRTSTIIYIHGGNIRESKSQYRDYLKTTNMHHKAYPTPTRPSRLSKEFPDANIIAPRMPRKQRAQYDERKLWMDRCLEFIAPEEPVIWIGRSLGALFLAKYLTNQQQRVDHLHLVAGIYDATLEPESYTQGYFPSGRDLAPGRHTKIDHYPDVHLRHSTDDFVVKYTHTQNLSQTLSQATLHTFDDRNHFLQGDFPELRTSIHGVT